MLGAFGTGFFLMHSLLSTRPYLPLVMQCEPVQQACVARRPFYSNVRYSIQQWQYTGLATQKSHICSYKTSQYENNVPDLGSHGGGE